MLGEPRGRVDRVTACRVNLQVKVRAGRVSGVAGLPDEGAGGAELAQVEKAGTNVEDLLVIPAVSSDPAVAQARALISLRWAK